MTRSDHRCRVAFPHVSDVTLYATSADGAAYTSGATLVVDGGMSLVAYPKVFSQTGDTCKFPVYGDASALPPKAKL